VEKLDNIISRTIPWMV